MEGPALIYTQKLMLLHHLFLFEILHSRVFFSNEDRPTCLVVSLVAQDLKTLACIQCKNLALYLVVV